MAAEELNRNELDELVKELRVLAEKQGGDELKSVLAKIAFVLASMNKVMIGMNEGIDEVAWRERSRDRAQQTLQQERAMRFLARLIDADRDRLVQAVETTQPDVSLSAFANRVASTASFYSWDVDALIQTLGSWYGYLSQREAEEDVERVASLLVDPTSAEASLADLLSTVNASNPASPFMMQLKRLLRCHRTLGVTFKAEMLSQRHERRYGYATVSTDVRPIFGYNIESAPSYGIVLHNLILGVVESGMSRTYCVGLSSNDILALAGVLDRAWSKDKTLRSQAAYKLLPIK